MDRRADIETLPGGSGSRSLTGQKRRTLSDSLAERTGILGAPGRGGGMVDAAVSKTAGPQGRAGSSPAPGTTFGERRPDGAFPSPGDFPTALQRARRSGV